MNSDSDDLNDEKNLNLIIVRLDSKFDEVCLLFSKIKCENKKHKNYHNDIVTLNNTYKRLVDMFEKKKTVFKNVKRQIIPDEENIYYYDYSIIKAENTNINSNFIDEQYYSQQLHLDKQKEYEGDKEKMEQIVQIKNQIAQLTNTIQKQSMNSTQAILEIEQNVDETEKNIDKTNENLRQAALYKNKSNTIKYPIALGTIFGAAGTIVPGIGNVIGATLGTTIGYAVAKLEKKAINKIEPEKSKK